MGNRELMLQFLEQKGPGLSTEIAGALASTYGWSDEHSRQIISRGGSSLKKFPGLVFSRGARFVYLDFHFQKPEFTARLQDAMIRYSHPAGIAVLGLRSRGGGYPKSLFAAATACPVSDRKGRLKSERVLDLLEKAHVVITLPSEKYGDIVQLADNPDWLVSRRALFEVETIALEHFSGWAQRLNLSAWNKTQIRGDICPNFAGYGWDMVVPSYVHGLKTWRDAKPLQGYLVADAIFGRRLSMDDAKALAVKFDRTVYQRGALRFVPFILNDSGIDKDALNALRSRGFVVAHTDELWGSRVAEALRSLAAVLSNSAAVIAKSPDAMFALFSQLKELQGRSLKLHGTLFEFLCAHYFNSTGDFIEMRKIIQSPGGQAEIDIQATRPGRDLVRFVEMKAFHPGNEISLQEVKTWVEKKVPRITAWYSRYRGESLPGRASFLLVMSCRVPADVAAYLDPMKTRGLPIEYWDLTRLEKEFRDAGQSRIIDVFRENYRDTL